MEPFRHHVFVCTQEKAEGVTSCSANRSWDVLQSLERAVRAKGLDDDVQVTTCGCLGLCDDGPILIVYPEGTWYRRVQQEDVPEIVSSHLGLGRPVDRFAWNDSPAMKKQSAQHRDRYRAAVKAKDLAGTLPDDLYEMIRGFMPSRAVLTALELDLFTAVGDGASAESAAAKIHADAHATEMLLNVLVSLKLLEKKDGIFVNTSASRRFFAAGSRDNARDGLLHMAHIWHRWSTLTDAVRAGTALLVQVSQDGWVESFIAAMDRNAKERAGLVVKNVADPSMKRMLDLGGGSGAYSIAFTRSVPGLQSEILDLPEVVSLTHEYIRKEGLANRITSRAGDMLRDPLGENYDLILVSAICHMFSPKENQELFQRAFAALSPQGKLVVQDFILEANKTAPRHAALFSLNMLVGTQAGSSYSEPEYATWLRQAGFSDVRRIRLPGPSGLIIGVRSQAALQLGHCAD